MLSVVPALLLALNEMVLPGDQRGNGFFETMKALRMLRLLKLARHYEGSIVIYRALRLSIAPLCAPFFFLLVGVTSAWAW